MIGFWEIFKYSSKADKCLVIFGICCAVMNGILAPIYALIIGEIFGMFDPNLDEETRASKMENFVIYSTTLVVFTWLFGYLSYSIL